MDKYIKKAVLEINADIERIENNNYNEYNFLDDFDPDTFTAKFINDCLTNNRLDTDKMGEYSTQQQKDYLHNILTQWKGMPYSKADKMLAMNNKQFDR